MIDWFYPLVLGSGDGFNAIQSLINQWGQVALSLSAIGAVVWGVIKFALIKPLDRRIAEATKQIQPNANGGKSLSDVNKKVDDLANNVAHLTEKIEKIEDRQMEIMEHLINMAKPKPRSRKATSTSKDTSDD